jgi:pilus assembly protein CpaB
MNLFRNKFLIGLLCIALGLAVGFLAIPKLKGKDSLEQVQAIRMKQTVPEGALITDEMVESIEVNPALIPAGTITDLALVTNRYSKVPVFTGDYLTTDKLTDDLTTMDPMAIATTKGLKVVSITLPSLAAGVSGQLKPGDIVTIMASEKQALADQTQTLNPKEQDQSSPSSVEASTDPVSTKTQIFPELQYVEVCFLTSADGREAHVSKILTDDEKNQLPVTISLFVTETQAIRLADLEQSGEIHLSFVARGKDAAQFIPDNQLVLTAEEDRGC